jgi:hypothetical protein
VAVFLADRVEHLAGLVELALLARAVTLTGIDIDRFRSGQIAEMWHVEDFLGLLRQIQNPDP